MTDTATAADIQQPSPGSNPPPPGRDRAASTVKKGHIGRIVVGSVVGGFLAAVVLTVGPLAGAEEHMVTGSVLLAFGAAWAALAALSSRRTDQPQRWARIPAAAMTVAGLTILLLAPTGNELGWVWPAALTGLVAWMVVQARRQLRSRTRALVLYPVFAALLLAALGGGYETYRETTDRSNLAIPGRMIDVGGHRLHINCTGSGSPTVVLEPGLGEPSAAMALIARDVAPTSRVCVYDRAGRGWSESAGSPQDGAEVATDLRTLLHHAGEDGPYVLAGHSAGGLYVLNFARLYPQELAGVVLLDSMSPQQYTKIDGWPAFYEMFRRASAVMPTLSRFGVGRVIFDSASGELPASAREAERAFNASPRGARSARDEFSEIRTSMREAESLTSLGDRPLVVVTALKSAQGGWTAAQDELAALSSNSEHRQLASADHAMLTGDPSAAAESSRAINDVVSAVRTSSSLAATGAGR